MNKMSKKLTEYKAVVFDLDGTLYYQRRLRIKMAWMLGCYYLCHFWHIRELFIVKKFRQIREDWDRIEKGPPEADDKTGTKEGLEDIQYKYLADTMNVPADRVKQVIETWIYDKPLKAVHDTRDTALLEVIEEIRERGQKVFIFSDYPIEDKLGAIGLSVDGMYAATDERLNELKPSPKGLKLIMEDTGLKPDEILMVGDRMSRDGLAAENAGCDYLILPASSSKRNKLYSDIRA